MLDNSDFFSPENVDEQLTRFWGVSHSEEGTYIPQEAGINLQMLQDLRHLYAPEGQKHTHSLQRVWERLEKQQSATLSTDTSALPLLQPEPEFASKTRNRSAHIYSRAWAVLAATLFLVIMLGSLLTIAHFTRMPAQTNPPAVIIPTSQAQPTLPPDYPYPVPGQGVSTLPVSTDNFYSLSWSPDGKQVATATENKARIWDLASEKYTMIAQAPDTAPRLRSVSWAPDGQYLAVGTNPVQIVNPLNGTTTKYPIYVFWPASGNDSQATITALAWSPDSTMVAVAALRSDNNGCVVEIWNIQTGAPVNSYDCQNSPNGIASLAWSGDGHSIAAADGQTVQVWNAFTNQSLFQQGISSATNVAWAPGSSLLAFASNATTQVWNINTQTVVSKYPDSNNGVLAWAPDGRYLATANGSQVIIWNTNNGKRVYTYAGNLHAVYSLAWSPDGNNLASGENDPSGYNFARVWSA